MGDFVSKEILETGLGMILASPKEEGSLEMIAVRPATQERRVLDQCGLSAAKGVHGDRWSSESWKTLGNGQPDPQVQVAITNSRSIDLVAGHRDRWKLLGDNLYIDFDLSEDNLKIGEYLAIGSAIIEVSREPNYGCAKYLNHFGKDALKFLNTPEGKRLRLRGLFGRVFQDGVVRVGDVVRKV